jgi:hypothetical protein
LDTSLPLLGWIDWQNVVQTTWLFKYFARTLGGEQTYTALMLALENMPGHERQDKITKARKAWAVKKHRLPKSKPLQIYLSADSIKYLNKTSKSLSLHKDELIGKILLDQLSLHHKETATSEKLRIQNQTLRNQIQKLHVISMEKLLERASLMEKILELELEASKHKENTLQHLKLEAITYPKPSTPAIFY